MSLIAGANPPCSGRRGGYWGNIGPKKTSSMIRLSCETIRDIEPFLEAMIDGDKFKPRRSEKKISKIKMSQERAPGGKPPRISVLAQGNPPVQGIGPTNFVKMKYFLFGKRGLKDGKFVDTATKIGGWMALVRSRPVAKLGLFNG
jgi:hypothetical protein